MRSVESVDQVTSGPRRLLEFPFIYEVFNAVIGAGAARRRFTNEFVRPFPRARILDIGCGTGETIQYLRADTEYVGYDINTDYIVHARTKYGGLGQFFCARVSDAAPDRSLGYFDFVLAIGILHHLNDREAEDLVDGAHGQLRSGGVLVTIDPVRLVNQSRIASCLMSLDRGQHVRQPEEYARLVAKVFDSVDTTALTNMLRIPYDHFVVRATKD